MSNRLERGTVALFVGAGLGAVAARLAAYLSMRADATAIRAHLGHIRENAGEIRRRQYLIPTPSRGATFLTAREPQAQTTDDAR